MARTYWFWIPGQLNQDWAEVQTFSTPEYPHPYTAEQQNKPTSAEPEWLSSLNSDGHLSISWNVNSDAFSAPDLWFLLHEAPSPYPGGLPIPHTIVYAMHGSDFSPGSVVFSSSLLNGKQGVDSENVGFVSFSREGSKIQQVFVYEEWRRKRITVALFNVADLVIVSSRRSSYLNGGEITTQDGESLREFWSGSKRVIDRSGSVVSENQYPQQGSNLRPTD